MQPELSAELRSRCDDRIRSWRVAVERMTETASSVLVFGRRGTQPVVVKIVKDPGDEWRSGELLDVFGGRGTVRVYDYIDGALLLERLRPGRSLVGMSLNGADDDATGVLAQTIAAMSPRQPPGTVPTTQDWGEGFARYAASGDAQVPEHLLTLGERVYRRLGDSQTGVRLLHGDLHHENMLFDDDRGWLAIDPKGVVGEVEYEVGAALRNPYERPALYATPGVIEKRVERFSRELHLNSTRVLSWAFAQAVLAATWAVEDGFTIGSDHGWIALARSIELMLNGAIDA